MFQYVIKNMCRLSGYQVELGFGDVMSLYVGVDCKDVIFFWVILFQSEVIMYFKGVFIVYGD